MRKAKFCFLAIIMIADASFMVKEASNFVIEANLYNKSKKQVERMLEKKNQSKFSQTRNI